MGSAFDSINRAPSDTIYRHLPEGIMLDAVASLNEYADNRASLACAARLELVLLSLVDQIDYPVIVLDADRRPVYANADGASALRSGAALRLRDEHVIVADRTQELVWSSALRDCALGLRRLVFLGSREHSVPVAVSPLSTTDRSQKHGLTLVILGRVSPCQRASLQAYARAFGMTASEVRVAIGLLGGESPEEIAVAHQVSIYTVRTQIRCLLEKSGSSTVRALLLKLASLPPLQLALQPIGWSQAACWLGVDTSFEEAA